MEQIVPGILQRLSAADIVRMAGLAAASLGQELSRSGVVHSMQRQGTRLEGIVEPLQAASGGEEEVRVKVHYSVAVEIQSPTLWSGTCSCSAEEGSFCAHAAALLYRWLAQPTDFLVPSASTTAIPDDKISAQSLTRSQRPLATHMLQSELLTRGPSPLDSTSEIFRQMGLSELRAIAREYDISTNGVNKQHLVDTVLTVMQQTETVRRVAATLEKPQRQLLAAVALAGGSVTDEDLRGLFERFALGHANQLQSIMQTLQNKALLLRTSLNNDTQQRFGLGGALIDIGWYVPHEVRAALRVTVPVTTFAIEQAPKSELQPAAQFDLLADLLLVARALDGQHLEQPAEVAPRVPETFSFSRLSSASAGDGSMALLPPEDLPTSILLETLQKLVDRPLPFLRFALRLLRLADILYQDDSGLPHLRVLPNAAELLLGPGRQEVTRDLFKLWLTSSSYDELYVLSEEGLRLRCRSTALNYAILRPGELDTENREARQLLLALLAQIAPDQWVSFSSFARFVYRLCPLFLQKRQRFFPTPHWWIERFEGRPLRPLQLVDWQHAEQLYLARLIAETLHWWGVCDVVRTSDGRLLAFRLTSAANVLFGKDPPDSLDSVEHSDPNLATVLEALDSEMLLLDCTAAAWPAIDLLEKFAEVAGIRAGRLCYRLTPAALGAAISQGQDATRLAQFLHAMREQNPGSLLVQMQEQLERRIANYGRVRIYTGVALLEAMDEMVMRELSATTTLGAQMIHEITPTLLILKRPGAEQLFDELKRRGQTPLLHEEDNYGTE